MPIGSQSLVSGTSRSTCMHGIQCKLVPGVHPTTSQPKSRQSAYLHLLSQHAELTQRQLPGMMGSSCLLALGSNKEFELLRLESNPIAAILTAASVSWRLESPLKRWHQDKNRAAEAQKDPGSLISNAWLKLKKELGFICPICPLCRWNLLLWDEL